MPLSRKPDCSVCHASNTETKLYRCQACSVVSYCGRQHQVAHREDHKQACNVIRKARLMVSNEERRLRSLPPDFMTPDNLFEEHAGHFWGILETRDYMKARYALVRAVLKIKTYAAAKDAYEDLMDMLRLCRSDNMGVRSLVPALCLRLGEDQECYDFCVWYATTGESEDYDWGDMELPYLDVKGADVSEPLRVEFLNECSSLSHTVAITLLKIKLCLDLLALRKSSMLAEKVPQDILNLIHEQILGGTALAYRKDITDRASQVSLLQDLQAQIKRLFKAVDDLNTQFWPALLSPGIHLTARPKASTTGGCAEMQITLQQCHDSWLEEPGAIDVIRKFIENKQRKVKIK